MAKNANSKKKPFWKRWWFIVIVFAFVVGFLGEGDKSATTQPNTKSKAPNNVVYSPVSTTTLISDLEKNALAAKDKYKGKYISTSGKVSVIDASGDYIAIEPNNEEFNLTLITCKLTSDEQRATVKKLAEGKFVSISGQIVDVGEVFGYTINVDKMS